MIDNSTHHSGKEPWTRRDVLRLTAVASGTLAAGGVLTSCGGAIGGGAESAELSKELDFIVPASPGGGFDTTARTMSPYLEKYLPQGTHITVRNMPGANYTTAVNEIMQGENDTIGLFNVPGELAGPITGKASYDLSKIKWIGTPAKGTYVAVGSPANDIKSLQDLKSLDQLDVGVETLTSTSSVGTQIGLSNLGFKQSSLNLVTHEGSSEAILAAIRGDVDFVQYPYPPLKEYILGSSDLNPLWVYSDKRFKSLPEVPTFEEVGGDPKLLDVVALYRPIGVGPKTSPKALQTLRQAYGKAMRDPKLFKEMQKQELGPQHTDAKETRSIIRNGTEQMRKYKSLLM